MYDGESVRNSNRLLAPWCSHSYSACWPHGAHIVIHYDACWPHGAHIVIHYDACWPHGAHIVTLLAGPHGAHIVIHYDACIIISDPYIM